MEDDLRYLRQQDVVDMKRLSKLSLTLIGAGFIGSVTAFWLGKMGLLDITVFDGDIVASHNWANQLYRASDVDLHKGEALREVMQSFGIQPPTVILADYTVQHLNEVVISAVDSMNSRKTIWKSVRKQPQVQLYLDARMGLETLMVYAVRPQVRDDRVRYSQTLHSDSEALAEPCTARTICYTPLMAASVLCNMVKRYANGEGLPGQVALDMATYTLIV